MIHRFDNSYYLYKDLYIIIIIIITLYINNYSNQNQMYQIQTIFFNDTEIILNESLNCKFYN